MFDGDNQPPDIPIARGRECLADKSSKHGPVDARLFVAIFEVIGTVGKTMLILWRTIVMWGAHGHPISPPDICQWCSASPRQFQAGCNRDCRRGDRISGVMSAIGTKRTC